LEYITYRNDLPVSPTQQKLLTTKLLVRYFFTSISTHEASTGNTCASYTTTHWNHASLTGTLRLQYHANGTSVTDSVMQNSNTWKTITQAITSSNLKFAGTIISPQILAIGAVERSTEALGWPARAIEE
jgi:hypothetical protein